MARGRQLAWLSGFLVALTVALIATALSAGAGPAELPLSWRSEPGYVAVDSELWLMTNPSCGWVGGKLLTNENNPDWPANSPGCGYVEYYWAPTCTEGPQTFTMTRRLDLPGPPADLVASLVSYHNQPMKSIELVVNGTPILTSTHSVHKVNIAAKRSAFKFGMNEIQVVAQKLPTKKPCNADTTDTGIWLALYAKFEADLVVTAKDPGRLPSALFSTTFTVTNKGPSWENYYSAGMTVSTENLLEPIKVAPSGTSFAPGSGLAKGCTAYTSGSYSTTCVFYEPLAPGESRTFVVEYVYKAPATGNFADSFTRTYSGGGDTLDPAPANSFVSTQGGACRPVPVSGPCVKP